VCGFTITLLLLSDGMTSLNDGSNYESKVVSRVKPGWSDYREELFSSILDSSKRRSSWSLLGTQTVSIRNNQPGNKGPGERGR
jgi:hypothetical protein